MTIDVADLRKRAERTFPQVYPSELTELLDAYEERDRLRDEIERAAQLAVEAKNTILKLRGSLDFAQTETERERLRAAMEEQGFLQKNADGSTRWHVHGCPASFDFAQCNPRCRVARAALEGRE